jgi:hypothetical protein
VFFDVAVFAVEHDAHDLLVGAGSVVAEGEEGFDDLFFGFGVGRDETENPGGFGWGWFGAEDSFDAVVGVADDLNPDGDEVFAFEEEDDGEDPCSVEGVVSDCRVDLQEIELTLNCPWQ